MKSIALLLAGDTWTHFATSETIEDELCSPLEMPVEKSVIRVYCDKSIDIYVVKKGMIVPCKRLLDTTLWQDDKLMHSFIQFGKDWIGWWDNIHTIDPSRSAMYRIILLCNLVKNDQRIIEITYAIVKTWFSIDKRSYLDEFTNKVIESLSVHHESKEYEIYAEYLAANQEYRTTHHLIANRYLMMFYKHKTEYCYYILQRIVDMMLKYSPMVDRGDVVDEIVKTHINIQELIYAAGIT